MLLFCTTFSLSLIERQVTFLGISGVIPQGKKGLGLNTVIADVLVKVIKRADKYMTTLESFLFVFMQYSTPILCPLLSANMREAAAVVKPNITCSSTIVKRRPFLSLSSSAYHESSPRLQNLMQVWRSRIFHATT